MPNPDPAAGFYQAVLIIFRIEASGNRKMGIRENEI
jgi:hypothetical protein